MRVERWVARSRDEVKPHIRSDPGLRAAYWLVDREGGKGLIITLWDTEEAMRASEESRLKRQAATAASTGARVTTDRYQVVDSLTI